MERTAPISDNDLLGLGGESDFDIAGVIPVKWTEPLAGCGVPQHAPLAAGRRIPHKWPGQHGLSVGRERFATCVSLERAQLLLARDIPQDGSVGRARQQLS